MKQLILLFVFIHCFYSNAQTDSLECIKTKTTLKELVTSVNQFDNMINGTDNKVTSRKFDSIIEANHSCLRKYEISNLYMDLTENLYKTSKTPNIEVYNYFKKTILSGYCSAVILNLHTGLYIKDNFPKQYKELEHLSDSMFIINCNRFSSPEMNFQLGFLLRYMIRKDQDVRTREIIARGNKDSVTVKNLHHEMHTVDALNELLLTEIFEQYGYPAWTIVGTEGSSASLIFEHMTPDFQVKYIHLLYEAGKSKQVSIDERGFKALIDRALMRCYNVSLYGSYNSHKETDKSVINKYRRLLQLPEEE